MWQKKKRKETFREKMGKHIIIDALRNTDTKTWYKKITRHNK